MPTATGPAGTTSFEVLTEGVIAELPAMRTLDVACGTGFLTRHLRGDVIGLDQSARMLEVAREQAPQPTFVQGDALALPFDDGAFDRVFTGHFYGHLEPGDRERFLAEARRVAPELVVVGSCARARSPSAGTERVLKDGSRWQVYKRVFDPDELLAESSAAASPASPADWFVDRRGA